MKTIHERGFAASGIRKTTNAAGVPQDSFTKHFASKEAFSVAVLDRYYLKTQAIIAATLLAPWQGVMLRMKVHRSREPLALFKRVFITAPIAVTNPTT